MVFAQIAMRENEITQALRIAQTCTVANHKPCMWTQHGDVVCGSFGIAWTDADIDQCDPRLPFTTQMIGRHLRHLGGHIQWRISIRDDLISCADKRGITTVRISQHLACITFEFLDVELVVCEQNVVLKMFCLRGGVMLQTCQ